MSSRTRSPHQGQSCPVPQAPTRDPSVNPVEQGVQDLFGNEFVRNSLRAMPGGTFLPEIFNNFGSDQRSTLGDEDGAHLYHQPGQANHRGVDLGEVGAQHGADSLALDFGGLNLSPLGNATSDMDGFNFNVSNIMEIMGTGGLNPSAFLDLPELRYGYDDNRLGDTDHNQSLNLGITPQLNSPDRYWPSPGDFGASREDDGVMQLDAGVTIPTPWKFDVKASTSTQDPLRTAATFSNLLGPVPMLAGMTDRLLPDGNLTEDGLDIMGLETLSDFWMGDNTSPSAGDVVSDVADSHLMNFMPAGAALRHLPSVIDAAPGVIDSARETGGNLLSGARDLAADTPIIGGLFD